MAEIRKLSVEKTLNKIRADDAKQSKEAALNDKIDVLDEEIDRMRAQRLRLERHQEKHQQEPTQSPLPRHVIRSGSWYRAYSGFCAHKRTWYQNTKPRLIGPLSGSRSRTESALQRSAFGRLLMTAEKAN